MNFDRALDGVLHESPIDPTRKSLCPVIFDDDDEMRPEIIEFIQEVADDIDENIISIVGKIIVKGSILSYQWLPTSDFDVLVEIDEDVSDTQYEIIKEAIYDRFKDVKVPGTNHPLQVFAHRGEYNIDNAEGVYDIYRGWVKGPYDIEADIGQYMDQFKETVESLDIETGKLARNIIDWQVLVGLPENEIKGIKAMIRKEMEEIEGNVRRLLAKRKDIKDAREAIFNRDMVPDEIKRYGKKILLPPNIIVKLLERYHYMDFLQKLDDIMDDDKISDAEMEEIANVFDFD